MFKTASGMIALMVFIVSMALAQQPDQAPCTAPEFRQFHFWLGEWEVSWPASATTARKPGRGTNRIEQALDTCVVVERFNGGDLPLKGMSVSSFNAHTRKWQQTWVDNTGAYLAFVGEFKDGQMILAREAVTSDGKRILQRMVWKNIATDSLDWSWERSDDEGKTWKVLWPIRYVRQKASG